MTTSARRLVDALLVGTLIGAAALLGLAWSGSGETVVLDLDGRRIALDEEPAAELTDVRATGGRFRAPQQGVDVPLMEMTVSGGVLNPPTLTDAFLVRDPGDLQDASAGGTRPRVVVVHAVRGGRAPGNAFLTSDGDSPAVRPGDDLWLDGSRYSVTGTEVLAKSDTARSPTVWARQEDGADRLAVITCLTGSTRAGLASHNLVIHAAR